MRAFKVSRVLVWTQGRIPICAVIFALVVSLFALATVSSPKEHNAFGATDHRREKSGIASAPASTTTTTLKLSESSASGTNPTTTTTLKLSDSSRSGTKPSNSTTTTTLRLSESSASGTKPSNSTTTTAPTRTSVSGTAPAEPSSVTSGPILGVLGVSGSYFSQERAAGIDAVTITLGWNDAEPSPGSFSSSFVESLQNEIATARSAGLSVVLDPGLQYPPAWVFSLPGGTRYVDQYGDVFTGSEDSGDNVANAVTDSAVREAEGSYLAWLGSQIQPGEILAVREGGGPLGELSYPDSDFDGNTNCYWAFDTSSQSVSPVPGWTPGTGTTAQAQAFLDAYNGALDSYGLWLNDTLGTDFGTKILVLLPGWGERPGAEASEVANLLTLNMPEFNEGLDWTDLLDSLPDAANSVAYTTYLDAPSIEQTPQLEDPADYIASLAEPAHLLLGGENTGDGTVATVNLCFERARALDYFIVQWMDESQLISSDSGQDPGGPTLQELGSAWTS